MSSPVGDINWCLIEISKGAVGSRNERRLAMRRSARSSPSYRFLFCINPSRSFIAGMKLNFARWKKAPADFSSVAYRCIEAVWLVTRSSTARCQRLKSQEIVKSRDALTTVSTRRVMKGAPRRSRRWNSLEKGSRSLNYARARFRPFSLRAIVGERRKHKECTRDEEAGGGGGASRTLSCPFSWHNRISLGKLCVCSTAIDPKRRFGSLEV